MTLTEVNFNNRRAISRMNWYHMVSISPETARLILDKYNTQNRNLSMSNILAYAEHMRNGTFKDNGDAIRFDNRGYLLDGQHRLEAVCVAGVDVSLVFRFGLDPETMDTIDDGRKRSSADVLTIKQIENPTVVSAASRLVIRFREGGNQRNIGGTRLTNLDIYRFVLDNPRIKEVSSTAAHHYSSGDHLITSSLEAALLFLCDNQYQGKDVEFFEKLTSGANIIPGSVVHQLRTRLLKDVASRSSNITTAAKYLMVAKALQLYITDRDDAKLYVNYDTSTVIDMIPHLKQNA